MFLALIFSCPLLLLAVFVLWCCLRKMSFCLTFDDGLKSHADIVAPLLEEHGWRGTFNVPVGMIGNDIASLTLAEQQDLCISKDAGSLMTWDDVKMLLAKGHCVYPHGYRHRDIVELIDAGRIDEADTEVSKSLAGFVSATGYRPEFFCSPHNSESNIVRKIVRKHGMGLLNVARLNFGEPIPPSSTKSLKHHIDNNFYRGNTHVDIMIHGISRATGGWRPFETINAFKTFLYEIKTLENSGRIKVVDYNESHVCDNGAHIWIERWAWLVRKTRRIVFKVLFRRK